jgi:hypothetical protein
MKQIKDLLPLETANDVYDLLTKLHDLLTSNELLSPTDHRDYTAITSRVESKLLRRCPDARHRGLRSVPRIQL